MRRRTCDYYVSDVDEADSARFGGSLSSFTWLTDNVLGLVLGGVIDRVLGLVLGGVTDRVLGLLLGGVTDRVLWLVLG